MEGNYKDHGREWGVVRAIWTWTGHKTLRRIYSREGSIDAGPLGAGITDRGTTSRG